MEKFKYATYSLYDFIGLFFFSIINALILQI